MLVAQIDDNEIAILGGVCRTRSLLGEVLLFNTQSNKAKKVVAESVIKFNSDFNNCMMARKGQVIGINEFNQLIEYTKGETDMRVIQDQID